MKFIVVENPPINYHSWSIIKTFWEEIFTPENMKRFGRRNVRKHKEIKNGEQYTALEISLDIDGLKNR